MSRCPMLMLVAVVLLCGAADASEPVANGEPSATEEPAETPTATEPVEAGSVEGSGDEVSGDEVSGDDVSGDDVSGDEIDEAGADSVSAPTPPVQAADRRRSVLVLDLESADLRPSEASLLNGLLVQSLSRFPSLQVLSSGDIRRMVDLEAEKQSLGCDTDSCLAEIAGAMGAQYVVYGQVGLLGELIVVQMNLFDSSRAQSVGRERVQTKDIEQLSTLMDPAVQRLVGDLLSDEERELYSAEPQPVPVTAPAVAASPEPAGAGPWPWLTGGAGVIVAAAGVGAVVVGALPALQHQGLQDRIRALDPTPDQLAQAAQLHDEAATHEEQWLQWGAYTAVGGAALMGVGLAVAAAGFGWGLLAGGPDEQAERAP